MVGCVFICKVRMSHQDPKGFLVVFCAHCCLLVLHFVDFPFRAKWSVSEWDGSVLQRPHCSEMLHYQYQVYPRKGSICRAIWYSLKLYLCGCMGMCIENGPPHSNPDYVQLLRNHCQVCEIETLLWRNSLGFKTTLSLLCYWFLLWLYIICTVWVMGSCRLVNAHVHTSQSGKCGSSRS